MLFRSGLVMRSVMVTMLFILDCGDGDGDGNVMGMGMGLGW